jgi:hypothetical protein
MGCSNSISPYTNKDIGFLKEYKGINKDDQLGDLYPGSLNPDGSIGEALNPG